MDSTQAILEVLGPRGPTEDLRTGDPETDLVTAMRMLMETRLRNTERGVALIEGLRALPMTYDEIQRKTGVPRSTANKWGRSPTAEVS